MVMITPRRVCQNPDGSQMNRRNYLRLIVIPELRFRLYYFYWQWSDFRGRTVVIDGIRHVPNCPVAYDDVLKHECQCEDTAKQPPRWLCRLGGVWYPGKKYSEE